ncbi:MAG: cysteine hydrolase [Candidatus Moduliflexus flocculans]|nr:cysteine hydrolase [Candidatus Moduliflexus flocculans]
MKTALLVIDMQKAIFDYHPHEARAIVENVND